MDAAQPWPAGGARFNAGRLQTSPSHPRQKEGRDARGPEPSLRGSREEWLPDPITHDPSDVVDMP